MRIRDGGELAVGEIRFSAAKIANTMDENGIGQAGSLKYSGPEVQIVKDLRRFSFVLQITSS